MKLHKITLMMLFLLAFNMTFSQINVIESNLIEINYNKINSDSIYKGSILKVYTNVKNSNNGFTVILTGKKSIKLLNISSKNLDEQIKYFYKGMINNFVIFEKRMYETSNYLSINLKHGFKIETEGFPMFSPKSNLIFSHFSNDYDTPQTETINIYLITNKKIKLEYTSNLEIAIQECYWTVNNSICLKYSKTLDYLKYKKTNDGVQKYKKYSFKFF